MTTLEHDYEKATATRKEAQKDKEKRFIAAVSTVLNSEEGRTVIREILAMCQVETINGATDVMSVGRIEGARAVGLQVQKLLRTHDKQGWLRLYREMIDG